MAKNDTDQMDFEPYRVGSEEKWMERVIFSYRPVWLVVLTLLTVFFCSEIFRNLKIDARFEKMLPMQHEYLQNMFGRLDDLTQKGLFFKVAVENTQGEIFDKEYLQVVSEVHDRVFYINGVDKSSMRSMWAPSVRWQAVTPQGFEGDRLIPGEYDGSAESLERVRINVLRSTEIGRLISDNFRSSIVEAYMFSTYPMEDAKRGHKAGQTIDFKDFGDALEEIRTEVETKYNGKYKVYIVGEPKMIGDLITGFGEIAKFGAVALLITIILLFIYARCWKAASIPLFTSIIAVIWQLGFLAALANYQVAYGEVLVGGENIEIFQGLGVFSMLVPFLIVAIGVSHSVQYVNAMAIEMSHGQDKLEGCRRAFRSNYLPGMTALLTDGIGFLTMILIPIAAIKELAIAACVGTLILILLKLVLLPILLSYAGISSAGVRHMQVHDDVTPAHWAFLSKFAEAKWAIATVLLCGALAAYSIYERQFLQIGDIHKGVPELRPESIYNQDNDFITSNYGTSSDLFVVMVTSNPGECFKQQTMEKMDELEWTLQNVEGVQTTASAAFVAKNFIAGLTEGHIKWMALGRNQNAIDGSFSLISEMGLANEKCSFAPIVTFLEDHKAATLDRVVKVVEEFAKANSTEDVQFRLATGNAGIAAAVNQEIKSAQHRMMWMVYGVVAALVFFTFPSLQALICIMGPLMLTSVLCEALMAKMGIGVKVATLPVIALGVGIGVDYGIYIYSRIETYLRQGMTLKDAYLGTLKTTGKAVAFTGMTLAFGVATWYWSDIQFQKDMGILLVFMFLWNMVGSLTLLPALAHFLIPSANKAKA
jgi:predicted RND superfamily exporter protein